MADKTGRTLIIGLGKTGLSCARYLAARGVEVAVADSRAEPPGLAALREELPDVALFLGDYPEQAIARAELVVVSPGVPLSHPALGAAAARGQDVIGDIELFARAVQGSTNVAGGTTAWMQEVGQRREQLPRMPGATAAHAPIVAITGANGKSTVTTLLGQMAQAAGRAVRVGGNLGTPALELLQDSEPDLYVLELSSFQLEGTYSLNAAAATVLNITPDHMDRYRSLAEYSAAKQRIFHGDGVMVLNADDPVVLAMAEPNRRVTRFTLGVPSDGDYGVRLHDGAEWLTCGSKTLLPVSELRIPGRHNVANALAALALGAALGLPVAAMLITLRAFTGLPHRTQWVATRDGVTWYNDSKGTNVGATLAAVSGMPGQVVLIAGGDGKGADFTPLREAVARKARAVVLIGRDAPLIEAALANAAPVLHARDMDEAVQRAAAVAQPGDAVLLSPACASFDMYDNYEHRGRVFTDAVLKALA